MLHEPATPAGKDPARLYKVRLGIWMFSFYSLFYAGFVAINLISPQTMGVIIFLGLKPGDRIWLCAHHCSALGGLGLRCHVP